MESMKFSENYSSLKKMYIQPLFLPSLSHLRTDLHCSQLALPPFTFPHFCSQVPPHNVVDNVFPL